MSWGALNNHRERKSTEPLPEFLMEQRGKNFTEDVKSSSSDMDAVITSRVERPYISRQERSKGYGIVYSSAIDIRLSRKMLFFSIIFFAFAILIAFCIGYGIGSLSANVSAGNQSTALMSTSAPIKKPIIPTHKKITQSNTSTTTVEKNLEVSSGVLSKEQQLPLKTEVPVKGLKNTSTSTLEENNKDNNGEVVYEETNSSTNDPDLVD
jgi:hypothetical protein